MEDLQRPERLQEVLAKDKVEDCIPCRLTGIAPNHKSRFNLLIVTLGAAAFMGLGAYSYFSGHSQLQAQQAKILASKSMFGMKSRRAGITGIALSLGMMGFWRLVN